MGKIVMGYWDCGYCDGKRIPGSLRDCPNCGRPRLEGTKFYMDGVKAVDHDTANDVRKRGRDWSCPYCDSLNRGDTSICASCGGNRNEFSGDIERPVENSVENVENFGGNVENFGGSLSNISVAKADPDIRTSTRAGFGFLHSKAFRIAMTLLTVALVIAGVVLLLIPKPVTFEITDMSWEYRLDIERYQTIRESDWVMPPDGRLAYTREEIHHYDKVFDHYETKYRDVIVGYDEIVVGYRDLGNGYFEEITRDEPRYGKEAYDEAVYRDEPRYATKYYYDVDRWRHDRYISTSGHDKSPYWADFRPDSGVFIGAERIGGRRETYNLHGISDNGKPIDCSADHSTWSGLGIGDTVSGKRDIFGNFVMDDNIRKET